MADVIPFPAQTEDAVWESGGSLHAKYGGHVRHMDVETALERRAWWAREAARLHYDPTSDDARHAARRWLQFTAALDALDRHNRIVGRPSPYPDAQAEVATRLRMAASSEPWSAA